MGSTTSENNFIMSFVATEEFCPMASENVTPDDVIRVLWAWVKSAVTKIGADTTGCIVGNVDCKIFKA